MALDQVVRPLRALALLEAGYGFMQAMTDADGNAVESWIDIHLLFIEICKGLGLDLRYVCDEKDGARAYFGGVGVQFHDNGMRLYELHNFPSTGGRSSKSEHSSRPGGKANRFGNRILCR